MDSQIITFTLAAVILTITPGVDTMLVIRNVLRGNWKDGVTTTIGICSGLFVHAALSALGVSILLMHSATTFHLFKLAGALYLMWLGIQSLLRAKNKLGFQNTFKNPIPTKKITQRQCFWEGYLSNILNPKAIVFYLAFLPQFISSTESALTKSMLLAGIHYVEGIIWLVGLSILLDNTKKFILNSSISRWMDGLCGIMLVSFGARLMTER